MLSSLSIQQPQEMNVDEMVSTLNDLEAVAPSKEAYNSLCLLLAYPKLCDHMDYKHWNPSNARFEIPTACIDLGTDSLSLSTPLIQSH